jgi:hypothetical protein
MGDFYELDVRSPSRQPNLCDGEFIAEMVDHVAEPRVSDGRAGV